MPKQPNIQISSHHSRDQEVSDLHCLTFHPVACTRGPKNQKDIDNLTQFIMYLKIQHIFEKFKAEEAEITELHSDWSYPIRLSANENGCRMTGSIQVTKGSHSEITPLCVTGHVKNGISYFVIREDGAPACLVKNKCPFRLLYGQTLVNLTLSGKQFMDQIPIHKKTLLNLLSVFYMPFPT